MKSAIIPVLSAIGSPLPLSTLITLVRKYPKLAHMLDGKGDFIFAEPSTNLRYTVNCKSNIDRMLVRGDYERELAPILDAYLDPASTCIDCGANVGAVALRMGARLRGTAKLIAIEPGPPQFHRLSNSLAHNPLLAARSILVNAGAGSAPGELYWNEDIANAGNANLLETKGLRVPITTLDALVAEHSISKVGFVKIDVEGMEGEVIKGAKNTIQRDRPVLYYEASLNYEKRIGTPYVKEIEEFVRSLDYKVGYWNGKFIELRYPDIRHNLLAVPAKFL